MEFRFDISPFLKTHIVRLSSNLIPQGFTGDKRGVIEATTKISEILNELGEASARAQGLSKPVTTAQKLRNSDHIVYLLSEKAGKNGCVTGLLKVGVKNLYVFDANGDTQQVLAPCILDFYIHESRQRTGLGRELFEAALQREGWEPRKLAIDRPSEKLVGFLRKHYGLVKIIPQMNNFVVYEGFFDSDQNDNVVHGNGGGQPRMHVSASPNTALFGPQFTNNGGHRRESQQHTETNAPNVHANAPLGRYGARRPHCSMAEIIHSKPANITGEPQSTFDQYESDNTFHQHHHHHHHLHDEQQHQGSNNSEVNEEQQSLAENDSEPENDIVSSMETLNVPRSDSETAAIDDILDSNKQAIDDILHGKHLPKEVKFAELHHEEVDGKKPARYTKQHTGLKNVSYNVGAAVMPSTKMQFDQEERESFGVVKIGRPVGKIVPSIDNSDARSTVSSEGFTDQGYFDIKFHHNKLW